MVNSGEFTEFSLRKLGSVAINCLGSIYAIEKCKTEVAAVSLKIMLMGTLKQKACFAVKAKCGMRANLSSDDPNVTTTTKPHDDDPQGPPSKKRKLANPSEQSTPRPISPPWKKAGVEGPTSFVDGGRRRSTRTNVGLQPHSDKKHTRTAQKEYVNKPRPSHAQRSEISSSSPKSSEIDANERHHSGIGRSGSTDASMAKRTVGTRRASIKQSRSPLAALESSPTKHADHVSASPSSTRNYMQNGRRGRRSKASMDSNALPVSVNGHPNEAYNGAGIAEGHNTDDTPVQKLPRLRLKVKLPTVGIQHPSHVLPPKKFPSFRQWVESEPAGDQGSTFLSREGALHEAHLRERVREAAEPGNVLSEDKCSYYLHEPEEEPPRQYSHQDHFVAHAVHFRNLLNDERKRHRQRAKVLAHACAEAWRKRNKDPEEIIKGQQEESRRKHRQLVKDLQRQFYLIRTEIEKRKLARWEEEKKAEGQLALNKAIKQSRMLFEKRRGDNVVTAEPGSGEEPNSEPEDESNMSSNDTDSEEDRYERSDDGDGVSVTAAGTKLEYADTPSNTKRVEDSHDKEGWISPQSSPEPSNAADAGVTSSYDGVKDYNPKLDEVDPLLLEESDESTDMQDDMGNSDEQQDSSAEEEDEDGSHEQGLLGLFSAEEVARFKDAEQEEELPPTPDGQKMEVDDQSEEEDNNDDVLLVPNGSNERDTSLTDNVQIPSKQLAAPSPAATEFNDERKLEPALDTAEDTPDGHGVKQIDLKTRPENELTLANIPTPAETTSPPEKLAEEPVPTEQPSPIKETDTSPAVKTERPHLLRGTLREYQHFGLDWLAGLYGSNINGILADEMGLGKTIQTIALLAHLAVNHEVWGPHLVVVPTSVMLNWEMEFKKWCPGFKILTYYGTQDERRQKRKGWMDDDRWHVCVTSYQLVLQDQQVFKRRNWHYMILDEAHNIKNFRSQRWQTLLTFKTHARLLLTGTPLQNNLTELWSLLFFLMPSDGDKHGVDGFADLRDFSEWFRRPVEHILEHGRDTMDDDAKKVVSKLHTVLRPYILRRLKVDVEKQLPAKFEHVVTCRLSKRQRHLYDGFMSRAQTKETLASGNYLSIINCLMQLRKVCNHPDLFETRPITTSFAMPKAAHADYEIRELLVRRRLLEDGESNQVDLDFLNLAPVSREETSRRLVDDSIRIMAYNPLKALRERQYNRTNWDMGFDGSTMHSTLMSMDNEARKTRMAELERTLYFESKRHGRRPIYGKGVKDLLTIPTVVQQQFRQPQQLRGYIQWLSDQSPALHSMIKSTEDRGRTMEPVIQKFGCITPAVVARDVAAAALTPIETRHFTPTQRNPPYDPFHEPQMRLSIAFPDKRLLQYDCGKLQQLDRLLRRLQAEGHRALIFTQMTKMLDILEQFLNIHGHRYLRLDGATKIEERQLLTERFNSDNRILAFILSSRSGGLGINLTGADTVIFYDLDWNPAMDKQCQDRCHRIGQTRDVHIYRFVSEFTIESNILRKANQKRMLDDVVIQEGEFTADYFQKPDVRDMLPDDLNEEHDEAAAAMDRVLETRSKGASRVFEQAEDKEDIDAAKNAEKELEHVDDADFEEGNAAPRAPGQDEENLPAAAEAAEEEPVAVQPVGETPLVAPTPPAAAVDGDEDQIGHIDDYLLRFMEWNLQDQPLALLADKGRKKSKRGKEHRVKRHR